MRLFLESSEFYETVVKPTIQDTRNIEWVYNILDGLKEQDCVVCKDDDPDSGFMLVVDPKWSDHPDKTR